jgi:hypothetical protein
LSPFFGSHLLLFLAASCCYFSSTHVYDGCVALLVEIVAGDVLRPVRIEVLQRKLIWILRSLGNPTEFGILLPQIGLDEFHSGEKLKYRDSPPLGPLPSVLANALPLIGISGLAENAAPAMPMLFRNPRRREPLRLRVVLGAAGVSADVEPSSPAFMFFVSIL